MGDALSSAIELHHMPSRVKALRNEILPDNIHVVLALAAGDIETERDGEARTGQSRAVLRGACGFYIEQILLAPGTDAYRVLGAHEGTPQKLLRNNMAFLMRWLHPDIDPSHERSVLANRVIAAWDLIKTPERRAAYDASREKSKSLQDPRRKMVGIGKSRRVTIVRMPRRKGLYERFIGYLRGSTR
jgi:hypothetical protein